MNSWTAQAVNSDVVRVSDYLNKIKIYNELSPELENTNIVIEKFYNGQSSLTKLNDNLIYFHSQHGTFSLTDGEQLIRGLTGVDFKKDVGNTYDDKMALLCRKFPVGVTDIFGALSPCKLNRVLPGQISATLKVESNDLVLTSEIRADHTFWDKIIGNAEPRLLVPSYIETNKELELTVRFPINVAQTTVNSYELDNIEIGDVVLFDKQFIDIGGWGIMSIDNTKIQYQIIKEGENVCLKILNVDVS